ncbi:recQ-mediated genome instability protein 1 [Asimina triloba]
MRRRLRLHSSSDEDEDRQPPVSSNPNPSPNPNPNPPENPTTPFDIPDDDHHRNVIDVPESPTPSSPIHPTSAAPEPPSCPIDEFLTNLGLRLQRQWLDSCISGLSALRPGFAALDVAGKAKLCFEQFLVSDMNACGRGVLPENVRSMHAVDLEGPFVLQGFSTVDAVMDYGLAPREKFSDGMHVELESWMSRPNLEVDEVANIGLPLPDRYHDAPAGAKRCLKLSMTDGAQQVFGMEYRPIHSLEVLAPSGFKITIQNVHVRRGLLMLVPEVLEVLGGLVEDLDAARQRLVQEVNKPPRGKRQRNGEAPSLAARARVAAWPPNIANDNVQENLSRSEGPNPYQSSGEVATLTTSSSNNEGQARGVATYSSMRVAETRLSFLNDASDEPIFSTYGSNSSGRIAEGITLATSSSKNEQQAGGVSAYGNMGVAETHFSFLNDASNGATSTMYINTSNDRIGEGFSIPSSRQNAELNSSFSNNDSESSATPSCDTRGRLREGFSALRNVPDGETNSTITSTLADFCTAAASSGRFRQRTSVEPAASANTVDDAGNASFLETTSNISKIAGLSNDRGGRTSERMQSTNSPDTKTSPSSSGILNVVTLAPSSSRARSAKSAEILSTIRPLSEPNKSSNSEEVRKVGEVGQHLILSGEKEIPFTYLAFLLAKWTAKKDTIPFVRGKIKTQSHHQKSRRVRREDQYAKYPKKGQREATDVVMERWFPNPLLPLGAAVTGNKLMKCTDVTSLEVPADATADANEAREIAEKQWMPDLGKETYIVSCTTIKKPVSIHWAILIHISILPDCSDLCIINLCFLTGVKGFQFKKRSTYELQVYVDDGSLISEVLIDHNVVQKGIGYSPGEVTTALSSMDKKTVNSMKETVKKFQLYLANFESTKMCTYEGTMLVEINRDSSLLVALEMNQACQSSDAWLLLRRLRVFTAPHSPKPTQLDHIEISP